MLHTQNKVKSLKHKIFRQLFPFLKLKDTHLKKSHKIFIYLETFLFAVTLSWIIFKVFFYSLLFSHSYRFDNTKIYVNSQHIITREMIVESFETSQKYLQIHGINIHKIDSEVYITNTRWIYLISMLPPLQLKMDSLSSIAYTFNHSIYFYNIDSKGIELEVNSDKFIETITHEFVHIWQENLYGSWLYMLWQPTWVYEGYAVYIANQLMNTQKEKDKNFLLLGYEMGYDNLHISDKYIFWALMIKHAIEKMGKSVDELHLGKVAYDEVLDSLLDEYNITKE